jgi:hypothetical protein
MDAEIVGACRVCAGPVVRVTKRVYRGDPMHAIAGPGGRNQLTTEVRIACGECGVMYSKPPPPAASDKRPPRISDEAAATRRPLPPHVLLQPEVTDGSAGRT